MHMLRSVFQEYQELIYPLTPSTGRTRSVSQEELEESLVFEQEEWKMHWLRVGEKSERLIKR